MDNKIIQEFGTDILCYRLRTARQKTRLQYKDFDKRLIQIAKEQSELWQIRYNLGWEPLVPPIQKGWKRSFILREDVAATTDAEFFKRILEKINTYHWSPQKNFRVKKRRFGRKYYVVKPQQLKEFYEGDFERQKFGDRERQCFDKVYIYHKKHLPPMIKYVFRESWRFVLQVRPNIIDKVRIRDHELESRIRRIRDYIERNGYNGRLDKIVYGRSLSRCDRGGIMFDEQDPLKNKPLTRILDELSWNDTSHA